MLFVLCCFIIAVVHLCGGFKSAPLNETTSMLIDQVTFTYYSDVCFGRCMSGCVNGTGVINAGTDRKISTCEQNCDHFLSESFRRACDKTVETRQKCSNNCLNLTSLRRMEQFPPAAPLRIFPRLDGFVHLEWSFNHSGLGTTPTFLVEFRFAPDSKGTVIQPAFNRFASVLLDLPCLAYEFRVFAISSDRISKPLEGTLDCCSAQFEHRINNVNACIKTFVPTVKNHVFSPPREPPQFYCYSGEIDYKVMEIGPQWASIRLTWPPAPELSGKLPTEYWIHYLHPSQTSSDSPVQSAQPTTTSPVIAYADRIDHYLNVSRNETHHHLSQMETNTQYDVQVCAAYQNNPRQPIWAEKPSKRIIVRDNSHFVLCANKIKVQVLDDAQDYDNSTEVDPRPFKSVIIKWSFPSHKDHHASDDHWIRHGLARRVSSKAGSELQIDGQSTKVMRISDKRNGTYQIINLKIETLYGIQICAFDRNTLPYKAYWIHRPTFEIFISVVDPAKNGTLISPVLIGPSKAQVRYRLFTIIGIVFALFAVSVTLTLICDKLSKSEESRKRISKRVVSLKDSMKNSFKSRKSRSGHPIRQVHGKSDPELNKVGSTLTTVSQLSSQASMHSSESDGNSSSENIPTKAGLATSQFDVGSPKNKPKATENEDYGGISCKL